MGRPVTSVEARDIHLLYGEGPGDAAFLKHLHSIFCPRGEGFQIKTAGNEGGDPVNVLRKCINHRRRAEYSSRTVLIDTDRPWCPDQVIARARQENISLLPSRPCLEGLLLAILGEVVPATTEQCKKFVKRNLMAPAEMLSHPNYQKLFHENRLLEAANRIPTLAALIGFLQTGKPPETILPDA